MTVKIKSKGVINDQVWGMYVRVQLFNVQRTEDCLLLSAFLTVGL
jgi:hypothetical protein